MTSEVVCESISLIFVELKRFRKSLDECRDHKEEWLYALRNAGGTNRIPDSIRQKGVRQFYEACELSGFSIEKRHQFETNRMWELDYYSIINTAKRRGRAEGFEEGQAMLQVKHVKAMKAKGVSVSDITDITGLQQEEIEKMQ